MREVIHGNVENGLDELDRLGKRLGLAPREVVRRELTIDSNHDALVGLDPLEVHVNLAVLLDELANDGVQRRGRIRG